MQIQRRGQGIVAGEVAVDVEQIGLGIDQGVGGTVEGEPLPAPFGAGEGQA